jgi:hypothetical protein
MLCGSFVFAQVKDKENKETRAIAFKLLVLKFQNKYKIETLKEFFEYWTETGDSDTKLRFEKEKTFGLSQRLSRWEKNKVAFSNEKPKEAFKLNLID